MTETTENNLFRKNYGELIDVDKLDLPKDLSELLKKHKLADPEITRWFMRNRTNPASRELFGKLLNYLFDAGCIPSRGRQMDTSSSIG